MKFDETEVWGFEHALRGMRNPLESWNRSDSKYKYIYEFGENHPEKVFIIGQNDLDLAKRLIKAGDEHRKFIRQIFVSVDIAAPLYWWKEFDTYKIGITSNSTSTMHKIQSKQITLDCFEIDDFNTEFSTWTQFPCGDFNFGSTVINGLEQLRQKYLETKDKRYWKELIRWLPSSWLQTRTVTMNYENVVSIYHQRKNHKLTEWSNSFCRWCESLPYFKEMFLDD